MLRQQDGKWIIAEELSSLEKAMPESVRSLVQRKIDALDEADRRLLGRGKRPGDRLRFVHRRRGDSNGTRTTSKIVSRGSSANTRSCGSSRNMKPTTAS